MEIGIDEFDDEFELEGTQTNVNDDQTDDTINDTTVQDNQVETEDDFIQELLKSKGIEDYNKIKFEDEEGNMEERSWNDLTNEEKFNIISNDEEPVDNGLDDSEIELINQIRQSGVSPSEYLDTLVNNSINNYIQNNQQPSYEVDQYSDDELFVYDFISRMGDVTEEEAREALEKAKSNEALFAKQIGAIRNEYKNAEEESIRQAQYEQEEYAQEQFNQYADSIAQHVDNLSEFSGYDLNMEDDDKQMLYDFLVGVDAAGNNFFAKALSDPETLVKTAWLALNGEQMVSDITNYFQKEISKVRKESYQKGLNDAKSKKPDVVYKEQKLVDKNDVYDDLD